MCANEEKCTVKKATIIENPDHDPGKPNKTYTPTHTQMNPIKKKTNSQTNLEIKRTREKNLLLNGHHQEN